MKKKSRRQSKKQSKLASMLSLISKRPLGAVGGVWAIFLIVSAIAGANLTGIGILKPAPEDLSRLTTFEESPQEEFPLTDIISQLPQIDRLPPWLYSAIALGCTSTALFIALSLGRSQPRRKTVKRAKKRLNPAPVATVRQEKRPVKAKSKAKAKPTGAPRKATVKPTASIPSPQIQRQSSESKPVLQTVPSPTSTQTPLAPQAQPQKISQPSFVIQSKVTVVPHQEHHPLDGETNNVSLVDIMDLRKRQSLRSLTRDR